MSNNWGKRVRQRLARKKRCYYCDSKLTWDDLSLKTNKTVDHFIPLSKGGRNTNDNAVICCSRCNRMKGNFMPDEFIEKLNRLIKNRAYQVYSENELYHIICQVEKLIKVKQSKK